MVSASGHKKLKCLVTVLSRIVPQLTAVTATTTNVKKIGVRTQKFTFHFPHLRSALIGGWHGWIFFQKIHIFPQFCDNALFPSSLYILIFSTILGPKLQLNGLFWENLSKMGNFEEILAKKKIKIDLKQKFLVTILRART